MVIGWKDRAQGGPANSILPEKSDTHRVTTIQALSWLKEMTSLLRADAPEEAVGMLFLYRGNGDQLSELPEQQLVRGYKRLPQRTSLAQHNIVPSTLRASFLLDDALRNQGSLIEAQLLGNHASMATTHGYTCRFPTRLMYEMLMRQFQRELQAVATQNIFQAAKRLGLNPEQLRRDLQSVIDHGLALGPAHIGKDAGNTSLLGCQAGRMLVISNPECLAELLELQAALETERGEVQVKDRERWDKKWLPWLAFIRVAKECCSRGTLLARLEEARSIFADRRPRQISWPEGWVAKTGE
jgi:hypothetical protein